MTKAKSKAQPKRLTAAEIRRLHIILRRAITPWMADCLCVLALKGLKK